MSYWTPRKLAVVVVLLLAVAGVLGGSWALDMWAHRAGIHASPEASCADPGTDCAQKDLPAQVRAATAAEVMADLTLWQSILGTIGLMVGGATLLAAARAAHWAKEAATHTERGANIAQASTRAWLSFDFRDAKLSYKGGEYFWLEIVAEVKNHGPTPAVAADLTFDVSSFPPRSHSVWLEGTRAIHKLVGLSGIPIYPGARENLTTRRSQLPASILIEEDPLIVTGEIAYIAGGEIRSTPFELWLERVAPDGTAKGHLNVSDMTRLPPT